MSAGRIYWGQIAAVLGLMALGMVIATQWTATQFGFQAALGDPDCVFFGRRIYAPWRFFIWWFQYDHYARPIFEKGAQIILVFSTTAIVSAFGFSRWRAVEEKRSKTYGDARWANEKDVKDLNLTEGAGVVLGQFGGKVLRHDGDEHILVVAPTNSGKSVGVSLPTGLVWPHSYFTFDMKGEGWAVTSGLRAAMGPTYRFEPGSRNSHRYNPVTNMRRGDKEVSDAQSLARMLVDPEGVLTEFTHWQARSHELITTALLWVVYAEDKKTIAQVAHILADPVRPVLALLQTMLVRPIKDGAPHPTVAAGARQFLDMAEGERSGVVSTALGYLSVFRDPILAHATEASDFSIEELVCGEKPVSLYVIVAPEELARLRVVLRMFFHQSLNRLTEAAGAMNGQDGKKLGRRVLLMLDEFTQLGRLKFFEDSLAYIRGYRVKVCMVAQSFHQIAKTYDENHSIMDNAHVRIAFACNDERSAKRISDMLGMTTETRSQMNYAGSRMSPWLGHAMVSRQEVARPLLTPGEVMQLPASDSIIFIASAPPIRAKKVRYFKDKLFSERVRPKIVIDPPTGPGLPNPWDNPPNAGNPDSDQRPHGPSPKPSSGPAPTTPSGGAENCAAPSTAPAAAPMPTYQHSAPTSEPTDSMRQQTFQFIRTPGAEVLPLLNRAPDQTLEPSQAKTIRDDGLGAAFDSKLSPLQRAYLERKTLQLDMDR